MRQTKIAADDNPWLQLATIHGPSGSGGSEAQINNRSTWNRYMLSFLEDAKIKEIEKSYKIKYTDLLPFSQEEFREIENEFNAKTGKADGLPRPKMSYIDLSNLKISENISFDGYIFPLGVDFANCHFRSSADFVGAIFLSWADFQDSIFDSPAVFGSATFEESVDFRRAYFKGSAHFVNVTFKDGADFHDVICSNNTAFENAVFGGVTSFQNVRFLYEPPRFFGAKLHEGTIWRGVEWPMPKNVDVAGFFLEAYERLKLEMDRLKKHDDELNFFICELKCRRVLYGFWKGIPIAIYSVSDYGRSYIAPLVMLFFITIYGSIPLFMFFDKDHGWAALALSISNTLNVFGFRKEFFDQKIINELPGLLKFVAAVQNLMGTICIFLFGLGLKNRFRMR